MLVHGHGFALSRGVADHVRVELDVRGGLPAFSVIGLGGGAARDARERVHAALLNSGYALPRKRVTANLAPGVSARGAPAFDLVLACCVLASQDELDAGRLARVGLFAELGLGGDLRACEGVSAAAEAAGEVGLGGLIVARGDLAEARATRALPVVALSGLRAVVALLKQPPNANGRRGALADAGASAPRASSSGSARPSRTPARAPSTNGARGP
ncbi:MAG TPA: magnesium chelatase domain-containing protein [Solirubrobacteraceae bacterium]|jgi:magnesium chelatase family protein